MAGLPPTGMLTDFTIENGCTRVVPMSHRSRRKSPPEGLEEAGLIQPVEGSAGSVVLWHSGLYHQGGPNTSKDAVRVGLNIACAPPRLRLRLFRHCTHFL